ncbi:hypothetical protein ASPACDRAFT_126288 [Aspergillus aculeatus ATCC 16872]|uniref:FAD/NAD(P)-binding domain-containing protein n=1 Tax=Aspergillus aculeatus (strain ATCC 16872 / CBS 172.66 / WB 5094) TaxID=690307 RepID=A0A1L9WIV0_ASPA1|nr:uncharacterized protein ASPACDRAFT_126288 [Aspergillus aculeatus ATCC 16872]OJJ96027.1 hypothetical protein ASPACDRAFT_126288 [Aspergillus aculeatus ATCC 16872]
MSLPSKPPTTVIIIGAGISGLVTACQLKRTYNLDNYCIYDRQPGVGGTWWVNRYPGCAVDVPGFCYTFSFAPNPDFSEWFPSQAEILDYLTGIADRYDVTPHFTGNTEWVGAAWRDTTRTWLVTFRDLSTGQQFTQECRILISAVGALVNPLPFTAPGIEQFEGQIIHTARWREDVDLRGKKVAVIGNGASAIQLVPAISEQASHVTQFMRTPHHIVPSTNYGITEAWRAVFRYLPFLLCLLRWAMFVYMETGFSQFQRSKEGRVNRASAEKSSREYVHKAAPEKYWDLLIPQYEFGCKRRLFDRSYSAALHRNNVRLTNDLIAEVKPRSIVTHSGEEIPADLILLATGFALTHYETQLRGRHGRTREEHWQQYGSKAAFKSIAMSGFPNFFYVLGPNSGGVHTSTTFQIESYVDMIIALIRPVLLNQAALVEVKLGSEKEYTDELHAAIDRTVHDSSCSSFFIDKLTGKNWFLYPWNSLHLWRSTHWDISADWIYER